ncbi:hypothetical protein H1R20_g137, partial [Candolleomyces eurysporus]
MNVFPGSQNVHVGHMVNYQVNGSLVGAEQRTLFDILQPITDASHTRNRKRSPPDSACFPGTRLQVVKNVNNWARSDITTVSEPHMRWMNGYVGSGKSSISQEVCETSKREDRPVVSFFFFRNAGDRSKIWRLPTTLASQMAAAVPQTEPFIREAVQRNPALLSPPGEGVSLQDRMECLVYEPFKALVLRKKRVCAMTQGPLLMVLDGLDECDDKDEVKELIDGMLVFFNGNPLIPLRVFITSRVEEHIQSRLNVPAVILDNLVDHCSDDDIATFLHILFEDECRRNSVIRAYVRQHGEWPTQSDRRKLVKHIGGSFIFASAMFKFIMVMTTEANGPPTPMDRLPLALEMDPGLDGLYGQTLARSKHLPHFSPIISTIALLSTPLSTSAIAELLGIHIYEVVNVLVNLQAIIQVPGTDDIPVTLCHTSLRDFLTTQSRSGDFFAHPSHHVHLFLRCLKCKLKYLRQDPGLFVFSGKQIPAVADYADRHLYNHSNGGWGCFKPSEYSSSLHLCREALALQPGNPRPIELLANVFRDLAGQIGSLVDLDEAISLHREALKLRPSPDLDRLIALNNLGHALSDCHRLTGTMADLEEAISVYREALEIRPSFHPSRSDSLESLGRAILDHHQCTGAPADLEEAITLLRGALELRAFLHADRSYSLNNLGDALTSHHRCTGNLSDLEEAIALLREALELRQAPHPDRSYSLNNLGRAMAYRHRCTGALADLEEAISLLREVIELQPSPNPHRPDSLNNLGNALVDRHRCTGSLANLKEAIALLREALELRPSPDPDRSHSLNDLGNALVNYHRCTGTLADLDEAISLFCKALELRPSPHPDRLHPLHNLVISLRAMYEETRALSHLQGAIAHCEELLAFYHPVGNQDRADCLDKLISLLQMRFDAAGQEEDLAKVARLKEEVNRLSAPCTESAT